MTGKKAKNKEDWKTHLLQVRLSENDYQLFKDAAAVEGLSISDLVRLKVLGPKPPVPLPTPEPTEISLPGYPGTFKIPTSKRKRREP